MAKTVASLAAATAKRDHLQHDMNFLTASLKSLDAGVVHNCSICLEDVAVDGRCLTKCGHVFHHSCISDTVRVLHNCPECRAQLSQRDLLLVQAHAGGGLLEDYIMQDQVRDAAGCDNYGTKVARIVARLRSIRRRDRDAKVIVFVQWKPLMLHLRDAFKAKGIKALVLSGGVQDRQALLHRFQTGRETDDSVLLLSLADSVSGMNLVCANHCILVHPMFAENRSRALAYERQAVGRVHRQGQERKVHVYRFVTKNTIEEDLAKIRMQELHDAR